jgi:small subunit ribosomal protein S15
MARMHSKRHGKAKSRKPTYENATKETVDRAQIEALIVDYAKKGMQPAMIGQVLKQSHNVPYIKHMLGRSLGEILEEKGLGGQMPPDLMDLMRKAVNINSHLGSNKHDTYNRTRMKRIESKIWRLTKYYIRMGRLPSGWRYDPKQAELIIKRTA